jgi:hypothetical protein
MRTSSLHPSVFSSSVSSSQSFITENVGRIVITSGMNRRVNMKNCSLFVCVVKNGVGGKGGGLYLQSDGGSENFELKQLR